MILQPSSKIYTSLSLSVSFSLFKRFMFKSSLKHSKIFIEKSTELTTLPLINSSRILRVKHLINYRQQYLQTLNINNIYYMDKLVLTNVTPKAPIFCYDPNKIQKQLKENYILKKYLPLYDKEDIQIPYVIETFPSKGISGSFTLPPKEIEALQNLDSNIIDKHTLNLGQYLYIMYSGPKIKTVKDIQNRVESLFSHNLIIFKNYSSNYDRKDMLSLHQHWLSQDLNNLVMPRNSVVYPDNFDVSFKYISFQKHIEIKTIMQTHSFLENYKIKFIDNENMNHINLLNKNESLIKLIAKQPSPDAILTNKIVVVDDKIICPIDVKLINFPEKNLDMLASYSSLSFDFKPLLALTKLKGQLSVSSNKPTNNIHRSFVNKEMITLEKMINKRKANVITEEIFKKETNDWIKNFFMTQVTENHLIDGYLPLFPSIITDALIPSDTVSSISITIDPQKFDLFLHDIKKNIKFQRYFPTMQEYKTFDLYGTNLEILKILKKHNLLENYYAIREILYIKDIHDV